MPSLPLTGEDLRIRSAMIDENTRARAALLYARQRLRGGAAPTLQPALNSAASERPEQRNASHELFVRTLQQSEPPEQYIIRYYIWDGGRPPTDALSRIERRGELLPASDLMRQDIERSLAMLSAQLPGRFRFVATNHPEEADLSFAAVEAPPEWGGRGDQIGGAVILNPANYTRGRNAQSQYITNHEIGHALGLRHPFAVAEGRDTSLFQSVMVDRTRPEVTNPGMERGSFPTSFMPNDLEALSHLYPVQADRRLGRRLYGDPLGLAPEEQVSLEVQAPWGSGGIHFPQGPHSSIVYYALPDTQQDTLRLAASTDRAHAYPVHDPDGGSYLHGPQIELKQQGEGTVVMRGGSGRGTYLEMTPELIRTSAGSENITVNNNMAIELEPNITEGDFLTRDLVKLQGSNNRVSLPGEDLRGIIIQPAAGTHNYLTIRNSNQLPSELGLRLSVQGGNAAQSGIWWQDPEGRFHVRVQHGGATATRLTIELENPTPEAREAIQAYLAQGIGHQQQEENGSEPSRTVIALQDLRTLSASWISPVRTSDSQQQAANHPPATEQIVSRGR